MVSSDRRERPSNHEVTGSLTTHSLKVVLALGAVMAAGCHAAVPETCSVSRTGTDHCVRVFQ